MSGQTHRRARSCLDIGESSSQQVGGIWQAGQEGTSEEDNSFLSQKVSIRMEEQLAGILLIYKLHITAAVV